MELLDWARSLFALIATLALILGVAYGARRLGMLQPTAQGPRRLKISESLMIDPRRRLVIVRCDGREHVLLLSPAGDLVVGQTEAVEAAPSTAGAESAS
ncbi:MAG: flagellar biosynthetic protein FliO [Hyphomonadaceae bacterium JAD_PAG50586_4]|nr:MAG: flagellar biosynthetic protein FliO [Hyphomonadaceae bacterium JAD_PAG50586_4]